jgi:hypothetical protein
MTGEKKMNGEFLIPIFLFGGTATVLWKYYDGRHKERMTMIEKGINPADIKSTNTVFNPFRFMEGNVLSNLKWGLLFIFVGAGWLIGEQLQYVIGFHEESAIFGCILIMGGVALIIFYIVAARKLKNEAPAEK